VNTADDDLPSIEEQAAEWCWRLADGALTTTQQTQFDRWIGVDASHRHALEDMVTVWQGTEAIAEMPGFLALRGKALEDMDRASRPDVPWIERIGVGRIFAIAASLAVVIMSSIYFLHDPSDRYETGIGERRVVMLADNSKISIDASSAVTVDYEDDRRTLTLLAGRAKFDVAHDPLRPFSVTAGGKTIVATGTAFSVEILRNTVRVVLYEGHVMVLAAKPAGATAAVRPEPVVARGDRSLEPGNELITGLVGAGADVVPTDVSRSLSWEAGRLNFADEPLAAAVERVNRYADKPITIGDPATGRLIVNGVFDAGDTKGFLSGLQAIFAVKVREDELGWVVSQDKR